MCGSLLENGRFGARRGLEVGWDLAGWPSLLKMLEPKDPTYMSQEADFDAAENGPLKVGQQFAND